MLRHERQTVAVALAECLHHSAQRPEKARAGEVEEQVSYVGLRAQKTQGCLEERAPQRSVRSQWHSAGDAPLLVVASLAGGDDVDATTVSFLLRENLKLQKEEEKAEARRGEVRGTHARTRPSSSG